MILTIGLFVAGVHAAQSNLQDPSELGLKFGKLKFDPPQPLRYKLDSGATVYLLSDNALPLVTIEVFVRAGSLYEPEGKEGLPYMVGTLMRSGGSRNFPEDAMDEQLGFVAAGLSSRVERTRGIVSLDVMKKDLDLGFRALADLIRNPLFPQDKIDILKNRMLETYRRRNDDVNSVASSLLSNKVYGGHPIAKRHQGYPDTIAKITREDLAAFHKKYFRPDNMIIGVSGNITKEEFDGFYKKHFGDWKVAGPALVFGNVEPVKPPEKGIYFVPMNVPQCSVRVGHLGLRHGDEINVTAQILSQILGGGFNSRIVTGIRSKAGLAYVSGCWMSTQVVPGIFVGYVGTKPEGSTEVINIILREMRRIQQNPVSVDELQSARSGRENSFVFKFSSAQSMVSNAVNDEFYGYPRDQLKRYLQEVRSVTRERILQVAKKTLHPENSVIVIVGPQKTYGILKKEFPETQLVQLKDIK